MGPRLNNRHLLLTALILTSLYCIKLAYEYIGSRSHDTAFRRLQNECRHTQHLFCKGNGGKINSTGIMVMRQNYVPMRPFMYLYKSGDEVSETIQKSSMWEQEELNELVWAMIKTLPESLRTTSSHDPIADDQAVMSDVLFVDAGANIGWHTLNIAARGYEVLAFEGLPMNQMLLRSTLCQNPALMERVTLFPYALGARHEVCHALSRDSNQGQGFIANCSHIPSAIKQGSAESYNVRNPLTSGSADQSQQQAMVEVQPLDRVLNMGVKVLKVDVGGREHMVIKGATQFFKKYNVWFILIEYHLRSGNKTLSSHSLLDFVREVMSYGFHVSTDGFQGPYVGPLTSASSEDIDSALQRLGSEMRSEETLTSFNFYFVNNRLIKAWADEKSQATEKEGLLKT
jgi:FkbM family methyltransferase